MNRSGGVDWLRVLVAVAALIAAGVVGGLIVHWTSSDSTTTGASIPGTGLLALQPGGSAGGSCDATKIARDELRSVVTIGVSGAGGSGTGSGEIIRTSDGDAYILTNNHVIAPAASGGSINVLFADGTGTSATLVGRDPLTDLAVIKVSDQSDLRAISMGSSGNLVTGQPVVALGAPLGLSSTITAGIISAIGRTVEVPGTSGRNALLIDAIQTDAAINPGNSGGALVNCAGKLIGIPSAGASVPNESGESSAGSVGLGFAIPIDLARTIANEIISTGRVVHSYFGVQVTPVSAAAAAASNLPEGLYISYTAPGGPASKAGLQAGDVITKVDGRAATSESLAEVTLRKKPGTTVEVEYTRNGQSTSTNVTLMAQPG